MESLGSFKKKSYLLQMYQVALILAALIGKNLLAKKKKTILVVTKAKFFSAVIYLLKVNNRNTRTRCLSIFKVDTLF